jgi:two-component system cell cycle sensor histidine kinase/response regulator CckA
VPRELSAEQKTALLALGRQVVAQLESRRNVVELRQAVAKLKDAEKLRRDSEEKLQLLADNITDAFWITSPDLKTKFYISPGYEAIWGRSKESLYANPDLWLEAILPEEREHVLAVFAGLKAGKAKVCVEYRITRPDGTVRWVLDRGFQVRDREGNLIRLTGIATDITERREIEDALDQQQTELRVLFDIVPAMICFKDTENRILRVNKRLADSFGKTVRELEGKHTSEIYPQGADDFYADDLEVIKSGKPKLGVINRVYPQDGKERWIKTDRVPLCGMDDKVKGIVVMVQDITERRRRDEIVGRLAAIVDNSDDAIISKTLDGIVTTWNPAAEKMFGYTAPEMTGRPLQLIIPLDRIEEEAEILAGFGRGEIIRHIETVRVHKDGRRLEVSATISPIKDHEGKIIGASKIVRDITERKKAESELSFNAQRYRTIVEATTSMVWETPASGQFETEQPGWTAFTGQSFEEHQGWGWLNAVHPDDQAETKRVWSAAFASRSTYKVEHRLMARDHTYHNMMVRAVPVFAADGTISQWFGVHTDITERKQTEEALRLLNSAVLQSKESILISDAELDLPGPKIIFTNPAFTTMTGYTAEEALGQTPRILQGALTDKAVLRRLRQNLANDEVFEGNAINYRKDGTIYNQEWQVAPIHNSKGKTTHFVAIQRDITERSRIEARFRQLVDSNVQGVLFWKKNGELTGANDAFLRLVHYTREDLEAGRVDWMALTPPEFAHLDQRALEEIAAHGVSGLYEKEYVLKDGSRVPILLAAAAFADNPEEGVCFVVDLTERKSLEARLYQSQKMETVGKLAGGVAHEFNSILTAIIGQCELLLGDLPAGSSLIKNATEISKAAARAANLTRQLLAYGRKQTLLPQNLDLNSVLADMESTLRHLLGQEVDLRIVAADGLKAVKADAGQIGQVIMNIVLNAHEAMPNGGKITLETANISFNVENSAENPELKAGHYSMIGITDTGMGMSPDVKARIFEPFFSTKCIGQGTGLGLSTSYGIIKQSGGHISAYSELGLGTSFKIYLPQIEKQPQAPVSPLESPELPRGTETILLAEDDPALRSMVTTLLARLGYTVLTAADGIEALSLKKQRDVGHIDLLFTDVVMPHMSGKELSERIHALYPRTKILFTSAYTENAILHQGVLNNGVALLQKPFTPSALARKLREVLDQ